MRRIPGCWLAVVVTVVAGFVDGFTPLVANNKQCFTQSCRRLVLIPSCPNQRPLQPTTTALQAASPLAGLTAASPLGSLAILAGIVLIHESGHYLAARAYGINVEEFSVGVGPRLFGFEAWGNEFNLRGLPLGGYVRFPENYNGTLLREQEKAAFASAQEFDKTQNRNQSIGYVIANALTLGSLDDKKRREARETRYQAVEDFNNLPWWKKVGRQKPDDNIPEVLDIEDVEIQYYDDPDLLQNRPWQQRAVVLSGGVVFNLLLAFFIYFGQIVGPGLPRPVFGPGIVIGADPETQAPAKGVLRKNDVIVGVNGKPLTTSQSPSAIQASQGISDFISAIKATPDGESLSVTIVRGSKETVQPFDVSIQPQRKAPGASPTIGVLLEPNFVKSELVQSQNLVDSAALAFDSVSSLTRETASALLTFFAGLVSRSSSASNQQVSGPIGLIRSGSEVVARQEWSAVLGFAAAISINLGVVNALPFPALDGGQLVFVIWEAITGKKVDQRLQEGINGAAVLMLLWLSVYAALGDLSIL